MTGTPNIHNLSGIPQHTQQGAKTLEFICSVDVLRHLARSTQEVSKRAKFGLVTCTRGALHVSRTVLPAYRTKSSHGGIG